jgi:NADH-quinone oxidoreductase subunit J
MLTARGPFVSMKTGAAQWIIAILAGGALLAMLLQAAFSIPNWVGPSQNQEQADIASLKPPASTEQVGLGLMGIRTDRIAADSSLRGGMSGYLLPFEIISIHLVVVLIGAAYLARARRRTGRRPKAVSPDEAARTLNFLLKKP